MSKCVIYLSLSTQEDINHMQYGYVDIFQSHTHLNTPVYTYACLKVLK